MGKSFNDDVFNDFDVANINGLNISKEAIEENKEKKKTKIDLKELGLDNIDELKKEYQKEKASKKKDLKTEYEEIIKSKKEQEEQAKILEELEQKQKEQKEEKEQTVKRTMIFKKEYLDIINGLSAITNTEIKGTLNKILELGINEMRKQNNDLIEKALKNSKKQKQEKAKDLIF